jgi:isopenicillin N synthase-like dioxygenase
MKISTNVSLRFKLFSTIIGRKYFSQKFVKIKYDDLINMKDSKEIYQSIEEAYGKDGLGILIVENLPKSYYTVKSNLFNLGHQLAHLPQASLQKVERPDLNYSLGWSYGKEKFAGKADLLKGSYYANLYQLSSPDPIPVDKNIWPQEVSDLQFFFLFLGGIIREAGTLLLNHIDNYIKSKYPSYDINYKKYIEDSKHNTGRLLYYYSKKHLKGISNPDEENWCDWHNDHGSLTGLSSAHYLDENGNEASDLNLTKTGLYIQNRKGEVVKVSYGKEDLAFQVGETLQIHSGGLLHATPHAVKVMDDIPENISRVTFALFMEPNMEVPLSVPKEAKISDIVTGDIYKVPKIQNRF